MILKYVGAGSDVNCKGLILFPILYVAYICLYIDKHHLARAEIEVGSSTPELSQS